MSIDINWQRITAGDEGAALAESVRAFIHDKFQQVELPRFIREVKVQSFEFGKVPPEVVVRDVCDPLPDFYEGDSSDSSEDESGGDDDSADARRKRSTAPPRAASGAGAEGEHGAGTGDRKHRRALQALANSAAAPTLPTLTALGSTPVSPALESPGTFLSRSSTPGIPGGTSNLSYFHGTVGVGLTGAATPFMGNHAFSATPASLAGGARPVLPRQFSQDSFRGASPVRAAHGSGPSANPTDNNVNPTAASRNGPASSAVSADNPMYSRSQAHTHPHAHTTSYSRRASATPLDPLHEHASSPPSIASIRGSPQRSRSPSRSASLEHSPDDVQIVAHLKYNGDIHMSLAADILLDYPMPSFVGIPLRLNVTGLKFDGVALLAHIRNKAHFCFLAPEDANALVGQEGSMIDEASKVPDLGGSALSPALSPAPQDEMPPPPPPRAPPDTATQTTKQVGGLFEEIRIESEIGQRHEGKQVLKNVGKVEKFVLEQVRNIFESEFVYPSFWTFLV